MPFAHVLKQWLSVPEYYRVNEQVVFIYQAKICQLLYDARTSGDQHVLARFLLHLYYLFGNYLCLERGVAPGKIFHIFGEDDFAYTIHCLRPFGIALERFGISVGCRPIGCHDLVRYFTQDTHVGLHHPQGKKVEWEKMFRHRDRRSLEPCEPESKTGPGGCRNHALLRWREDPFR